MGSSPLRQSVRAKPPTREVTKSSTLHDVIVVDFTAQRINPKCVDHAVTWPLAMTSTSRFDDGRDKTLPPGHPAPLSRLIKPCPTRSSPSVDLRRDGDRTRASNFYTKHQPTGTTKTAPLQDRIERAKNTLTIATRCGGGDSKCVQMNGKTDEDCVASDNKNASTSTRWCENCCLASDAYRSIRRPFERMEVLTTSSSSDISSAARGAFTTPMSGVSKPASDAVTTAIAAGTAMIDQMSPAAGTTSSRAPEAPKTTGTFLANTPRAGPPSTAAGLPLAVYRRASPDRRSAATGVPLCGDRSVARCEVESAPPSTSSSVSKPAPSSTSWVRRCNEAKRSTRPVCNTETDDNVTADVRNGIESYNRLLIERLDYRNGVVVRDCGGGGRRSAAESPCDFAGRLARCCQQLTDNLLACVTLNDYAASDCSATRRMRRNGQTGLQDDVTRPTDCMPESTDVAPTRDRFMTEDMEYLTSI